MASARTVRGTASSLGDSKGILKDEITHQASDLNGLDRLSE